MDNTWCRKMNLSFAGCGFLGIYHVGVAVCFKKYAPHLLLNKISGASAGAIAACCLLCDLPIGEVASDMLGLIREARLRTLGPFSPSFNVQEYLLERLGKVLPEDAHLRVNGKLHISLTRVYDGKNVLVSEFNSKEDLLQALLASSFVPIFSGFLPPRFHGERYMDGGFSDNLPILDENTITVSPFCGETDICPRDVSSQLFHVNFANTSIELSKQNIYRFARILWPPKPEVLSNMCKQGFDDALRFLHRNNLINCTRCLAVQSTFVVSEEIDESCDYDPQCEECKQHRQEALVANLPDIVVRVFQDAIDSANKGLYNWMLSHRGMKLITFLSLPYSIPADFAYALFKKLKRIIPYMKCSLEKMCRFCMAQMVQLLYSVGSRAREHLSANATFQLEYDLGCEGEHSFDKELNLNIKIDESDLEQLDKLTSNNILSRRESLAMKTELPLIGDDTFENILQVTAHHEAIMAFYYLDDNNKVKVTEIFDVTDDPNLTPHQLPETPWNRNMIESWANKQFESTTTELEDDISVSDTSLHEDEDNGTNIFSDPESEWNNLDLFLLEKCDSVKDLRPESDQEVSKSND
ncbi:hypothetical protein O3M35_012931 [Rhynocoris fuscipes]|uniref:triacylglycerol lipase n=1 Tax=Rhynocoris fuscipes TaxID=488301 RepID=A0AAW1CHP7_9HEMI